MTECAGSGCCAGLAKLKRTSRWMDVGDSRESLERVACQRVTGTVPERGGGKKENKFTYIEGGLAVGVIGIHEYACWELHIQWGG